MEPENFQKENKNTLTNILLFLLLLVMVSILFFLVKSYQKENVEVGYIPNEEAPVNNPVTNHPVVTPNPTPGSNPTPTPAPTFNPNNLLLTTTGISRGDLTVLTYTTVDTTGTIYAFCEKMTNTNMWHFAYYDDENCENDEKVVVVDSKAIRVLLKSGYDADDLNRLNVLYGVETRTSGFMNGGNMEYWLKISSSNNYDSVALARIYFDTGYFTVAQPLLSPLITGEDN